MAITSIQKIISIGSSEGVTLPARDLDALGLTKGDNVKITFDVVDKPSKENISLIKDYEKFKKQYGTALKNLADR